MKGLFKGIVIFFGLLLIVYCVFLLENSGDIKSTEQTIGNWEIAWTSDSDLDLSEQNLDKLDWIPVSTQAPAPERPKDADTQWIKIDLPELKLELSTVLISKIYGKHILAIYNGAKIYESDRSFNYEINSVLLPVDKIDSEKTLYIGVSSQRRIGIPNEIQVGEYQELLKKYVKGNISDFILGSTLIFIAVIMLACTVFLRSDNLVIWVSLCAVFLSSGVIVVTYSSFLYWLFEDLGKVYVTLFDAALFILLPAFTFFFERVFGSGYYSIIRKFRNFQVVYSVICTLLLILNELTSGRAFPIYNLISQEFLGFIIITQFVLLLSIVTIYTFQKNKDAVIFSIGFLILAVLGIGELVWFYSQNSYYDLYLWKWGVVCFLISLIIILGRRFAENHEQVVEYSKQLEMFNNELQRSEKMEIISEMAASVAHEVRNPLQVTRGFIQLLAEKHENSEKVYLHMALDELDRASNIITDFLTFAKPEVGKVATLNLLQEFIHIEGILVPMANLQGGKIAVNIPDNLLIKGNSSKFKQAIINIIKNSIESLHGEGDIQVWGYKEDEWVYIHIKDNGEGMDSDVLARLGEPYFSNKTKGTGLGLMVTFRIIEVMQGEITFLSEKGVGTEAIIRFPSRED
ncbi:sensor histidine kinase [Paenibacillus bouchesdurhonensis]|uniref:sensor histidine kinase n=1 Tax=Paenibacillus bouchesdurhonensis TaxID=1870990 RepID=UPI000DA6145A|nr:sensor histidine kinase [Paenibacillus bouchesdurhonensis]